MAKYLLLMGLILFNSCEEEREIVNYCEDIGRKTGPVPFTTFEDISKDSINCYLCNIEFFDWNHPVLYIINDQQALDTLLDCSSYNFNFNFEEYTLLIGYFYTLYGPAALSNQEVKLDCEISGQLLMYSVTVDLMDDDGSQSVLIQHNAIVPKLPSDLRVSHWVIKNRLYLDQDTTENNK
jgi:hypothetical protein